MLCNAVQRTKNKANLSSGSENNIYCVKVCDFLCKVEISLLYSKNHFGAMLIGFGDT